MRDIQLIRSNSVPFASVILNLRFICLDLNFAVLLASGTLWTTMLFQENGEGGIRTLDKSYLL